MTNKKTTKFYDAYQELEQIARDMQDDPEKVVDVMEEKLKRALELKKICSERLQSVQKILDQCKVEANVNVDANNVDGASENSDDEAF